ncbi:hypothetical protein GRX01_05155 [Halobaculum sp. WSA2]|uniref:Uncharacterized protein n=1 Tax=Halobaculum saliterrae TaxID=2073113 RepID=A0A6B0SXP7_9EURY|nr:TCP-1/cpn60 chaperonin family protein [Halobaculum saliterrae]MXR40730.1 hypothetical protein [Halobaculum saliterrae]
MTRKSGIVTDSFEGDEEVPAELDAVIERIEGDETLSPQDLTTIEDSIGGSITEHVAATEAAISIARRRPGFMQERYPDMVESILRSRKARTVAYTYLRSIIKLRDIEVTVSDIHSGTETAIDQLMELLDDIAEETDGTDEHVPGRGATSTELAMRLREFADSVSDRELLVVEAVADVVEAVPRWYASETGLDQIDALVDLRAQHEFGEIDHGVTENGRVDQVDDESGWTESELLFRDLYDGLAAGLLVLQFERDSAPLLRSAAVINERI